MGGGEEFSVADTHVNGIKEEKAEANFKMKKSTGLDPPFNFPPGVRFRPNDEELIIHYLSKKVSNIPLPCNIIKEVNLYQYNPQVLAEKFGPSDDNEWYFFTPRDKKYKNGKRPNRAAGDGYWKATGADKPIINKDKQIGVRKALVFYTGKAPKGTKTNWIMHEFRVEDKPKRKNNDQSMRLDDWVLCRIYGKPDNGKSSKKSSEEMKDVDKSMPIEDLSPHHRGGSPDILDHNDMSPIFETDHDDSLGLINYSIDCPLTSNNPWMYNKYPPCPFTYNNFQDNFVDFGQVEFPLALEPGPSSSVPLMMSPCDSRPHIIGMKQEDGFASSNKPLNIYSQNYMRGTN